MVLPSSLQMGWTLPPAYLCTAIETERYAEEHYSNAPVGTLTPHLLKKKLFRNK